MATNFRFIAGAGQDNTGRIATFSQQALTYAATIALLPKEFSSLYSLALTGAVTLTAGTTLPQVGDEIKFLFSADATNRIVTFGTGFASTGTLTVTASKKATATFRFDGAAWVEAGRSITV